MFYPQYAIRNTPYENRESNYLRAYKAPLHLSRVLYKSTLFMQNKPNLPAFPRTLKMNINSSIITNYIYEPRTTNYELITQNKPNQTQFSYVNPVIESGFGGWVRKGKKAKVKTDNPPNQQFFKNHPQNTCFPSRHGKMFSLFVSSVQ